MSPVHRSFAVALLFVACGGRIDADGSAQAGGGTPGAGGTAGASAATGVGGGAGAESSGGVGGSGTDGSAAGASGSGAGGTGPADSGVDAAGSSGASDSGGGTTDASDGGTDVTDAGDSGGATDASDGGTVVTDAGDGGSTLGVCGTKAKQLVSACVGGPGSFVTLSGPVTGTGPAGPGGGCWGAGPSISSDAFWFEAKDATGATWHFEMSLPGFSNPLVQGQTVSVDAHYYYGGPFGPWSGHIALRDATGKLLGYVGNAGGVAGLILPAELDVEQGTEICTGNDGCGEWGEYDLLVTAGGVQQPLGYGQTKSIGGYVVSHGDCELAKPGPVKCLDWYVARVAFGARLGP